MLAAATAALAAPAAAQEAPAAVEAAASGVPPESVFVFNTLLFLIGGFLVMWMGAGFAMLEAGLVRTKNVVMQCTKNVALFALAAIMYYLLGYMIMYPGDAWIVDGWIGAVGLASLEPVGAGVTEVDVTYASVGSDFFFQLMFAATTASIVSGALAERIRLWPFLAFTAALTALIYPIQASWKWGGGFLDAMGFLDFAGSTVVHSTGGWAALAGAIILGPRLGKYAADGSVRPIPGSNVPLATLGTFILWLGWFGFNGGSQLALGSIGDAADVSRIFSNTHLAAAGGGLTALVLTQLVYGKVDLTMVLNGVLAGLVSITAEPLTPTLGASVLIGAVGGAIVVFTVPMLDRMKIDDVVGAIPVHLLAGIWGTLAVVLTNPDANIVTQLIAIAIVGAFVFGVSLVVWLALKAVTGIRVSEDDELEGLDSTELGLEAYPEFGKGSQFA
jgi:Amt family ammonium transporter